MGGCRCVFRECTVSTRHYPGMHFFHFPVKDQKRFLKWVEMAGVSEILKLPTQQQKNRVICARHFAEECFMNYKKDRLVANAVPTLNRLGAGIALDYTRMKDELPEIVTLVKSKKEHLIAPPGFKCPLEMDLENSNLDLRSDQQDKEDQLTESFEETEIMKLLEPTMSTQSASKRKQSFQVQSAKKAKLLKVEKPGNIKFLLNTNNMTAQSQVAKKADLVNGRKILNQQMSTNGEISNESVVIYKLGELDAGEDDGSCSPKNDIQTDSQSSESDQIYDTINRPTDFMSGGECEEHENNADTENHDSVQEQVLELTTVNHELHSKIIQYKKSSVELQQENQIQVQRNDQLQTAHNELEQMHKALQTKYNALVVKHQKLQDDNGKLQQKCTRLEEQQQQVSTVSTTKEPVPEPTKTAVPITGDVAPPPSKAQLFNGIKKYLSASMVALVRMEMFGSTERQWKPDEQRAAMDLLRLGEHVFKYFSDEWRFRLPALRQVRKWFMESVAIDDEEEDL